jgi:outer membrane murein-binding lipoprotein Lpp
MTVMKRILLPAVALGLFLAACGESQQFTDDFNEAQKPLEQLLADVSSSAGTPDAAKMNKLADGLDDTAAKIAELEPPDGAQDELDTFVKQVNASADSMREVGDAVESKDVEAMTKSLGELQDHMTKVGSAQSALQTAIN